MTIVADDELSHKTNKIFIVNYSDDLTLTSATIYYHLFGVGEEDFATFQYFFLFIYFFVKKTLS